eukprot:TRINITY_DN16608_c1_g1_i1.p1 TRINITY_DN16608_c1_g1~~TRINITY_DN16608_c1_g1_i1.p1  ORF type:complete len:1042 (-),score=188.26 TRINITY_DN16608_c1_g1_i1:94-3219(-)
MQTQFEYDLLGYPPRARGAAAAAAAALEAHDSLGSQVVSDEAGKAGKAGAERTADEVGDGASDGDVEDAGDECDCGLSGDEDDAAAGLDSTDVADTGALPDAVDGLLGEATAASSGSLATATTEASADEAQGEQAKKKQRSNSRTKAALANSSRLEELSKPKPPPPEPEAESFQPEKKPAKKPQSVRPSLLLRLKPTNLEEARERFFECNFSEAPKFTYAFPDEYVAKNFEENSKVCFELLPEANRILQKVHEEYGGPDNFMKKLYGEEKISAEKMRDTVAAYLQDLNLEDKVEIRVVEGMLSAANVVKPGTDGAKYIVNISSTPIAANLVPGICDHEVGTHLLRMMNDEHQAWHGRRDKYGLANPWTTEEGFATLNTYQTMPCKLLYTQALRYWAVCRGAELGFVELFHELKAHINDAQRCWAMCCRIKRGQLDTSLPGAFYLDQAYFKGAVEILRHLDEVDFGRLYGGQIALQDMGKVHFILRKEVVRLPKFLNSAETLKTYLSHCRKLIRENEIEAATERVCKSVFVRTAREFFKPKTKQPLVFQKTVTLGGSDASPGPAKKGVLDLARLEDLSKPRQIVAVSDTEGTEGGAAAKPRRDLNMGRLFELAAPKPRREEEPPNEPVVIKGSVDKKHLETLARPRYAFGNADAGDLESSGTGRATPTAKVRGSTAPVSTKLSSTGEKKPPRSRERSRPPRMSASADGSLEAAADLPPPPPPFEDGSTVPARQPDYARLTLLAAPRKCGEGSEPCVCPPKKTRRKRKKTRHRLLALVQERRDDQLVEEAAAASEDEDEDDEVETTNNIEVERSAEDDVPVANADVQATVMSDVVISDVTEEQSLRHSLRDSLESEAEAVLRPDTDTSVSSWNHELPLRQQSVPAMASSPLPGATSDGPSSGFAAVTEEVAAALPPAPSEDAATTRFERASRSVPRRLHRAVARARSFGVDASLSDAAQLPGGYVAPSIASSGFTARMRLPIGLPKGAAAALAVTAASAGASGGVGALGGGGAGAAGPLAAGAGAEAAPLWKAVPIKTFQLGI